jgi:aspartyl-tRNA(Asn)/glutamyl-tRNA(Gln) amidotransferase subunit A
MPDTMLDWPLAELSAAIREGALGCAALTEVALARARATQPRHNAFVEILDGRARAQAATLDAELAAGHWRGPLHGIPLAHKDCLERDGFAMTVGSAVIDPVPGSTDASVLTRLEKAGAIDLGRLHLNEFVAGPTGQNPHLGDCRNAWDPARISGGSSSGSAVAVALGAVAGSLGSDTGGSIRLPASMNGLFGLKPTYGRVSRAGCFPRAFSLDCIGPLARTAEDCALILAAIAGPDPRDPSTLSVPVADYASRLPGGAAGTRLGWLDEVGECDTDIATHFASLLREASGSYGPVVARRMPQLPLCYAMGDVISKVEAATLHGHWMAERGERYSQAVYSRTEPGLHIPATRYLETLSLRGRILQEVLDDVFAGIDVLMLPTTPLAVPTREDADMEAGERVFPVVAALTRLTRPFSFLGLPVLSIPIGHDRNGMPIGAQLVGRPFAEGRLLALGARLAALMGWKAAVAPAT